MKIKTLFFVVVILCMLFSACAPAATPAPAAPAAPAATTAPAAPAAPAAGGPVKVGLITKTTTNPFFVKMMEGADAEAKAKGATLMTAAGAFDGDNEGQVTAIENMVNAGVKGILITPNDAKAIIPAIKKAQDAGVMVIALDSPLQPSTASDALFATNNFVAGELIGKYAAAAMKGKTVKIAALDAAVGNPVAVLRHNGFVNGFGLAKLDNTKTDYVNTPEIVCSGDTNGDQAKGQTVMENCLSKNPDINVVYTINEPAAAGAYTALKAAGKEKDVLIVSIDGGCPGVENVMAGKIAATSQQYPLLMASMGVDATIDYATTGKKASGYTDTGVSLITDKPMAGVDSKDTKFGYDKCWGVKTAGAAAAPAAPAAGGKAFRIAVIMPSATTDMAFSQSMWSALQSVQKDMGGESALEIKFTDNMFNVPDATNAIRDYASQGFDIVIAHGSQYGSAVQEIAKDFPAVTFAWGTDVNTFGLPNVYAYTAAAEEGGYVNGVLAAKLTKSKIIGVTGPVEVGDAKTYIDGFTQGVASVNPAIKVAKTWTGSFSDVALMTEAAKTHVAAGADVLTGSSQSVVGSIGVAKDNGKVLWFGTQADQSSLAPSLVVASQVYDWTAMLKDLISKHKAGKLGGDVYTLHLADNSLKIAYNAGYSLPADVKAAGDAAIKGISDGSVKVKP